MAENIRIAKPVVVRNVPQMRGNAVLGSDEDHPLRQLRPQLPEPLIKSQTVHAGQVHVGDNQIIVALGDFL